jgi:hypothetical protein
MLFFRSEEQVKQWCSGRGIEPGPIVSMRQLWGISVHWFGNRLSPEARRPGPAEVRQIFASVGLLGPFWDPEANWP